MLDSRFSPRAYRTLLSGLLLLHAGLLAYSATRHSPTFDEPGHLAAGISHWTFGRFELYSVNPPLVRAVASLPVMFFCDPQLDWSDYVQNPQRRTEVPVGRRIVQLNGSRSLWYFTVARWMCIPFSVLGAWVCSRWARELHGDLAGLTSASIWTVSPMILGNAQFITPDVPAAAIGIAAFYAFHGWLKSPTWLRAILSGAVAGLALLTKSTWLILFPLWGALWVVWRAGDFGRSRPAGLALLKTVTSDAPQLAVAAALALLLLNGGYAFRGTGKALGSFQFTSHALSGADAAGRTSTGNRFQGTWLEELPVPLPKDFVLGVDLQKRDFERGYLDKHWRSYLCGEWKHGGWWYFYPFAALIKEPLGAWGLLFLAAYARMRRLDPQRRDFREDVLLWIPVLALLAVTTSQFGMHKYLRYMLPAWPFVIIWAGQAAHLFTNRGFAPPVRVLAIGFWAWMVGSSLWYYPHSLSYFNELVGGPSHGGKYLLDSNCDWGQDLIYLKEWLDRHPEAHPLSFAYFGSIDPAHVGIDFQLPPAIPERLRSTRDARAAPAPVPGWYAVSVSYLHGHPMPVPDGAGERRGAGNGPFRYFSRFEPVDRAGYSILIYHLTAADVR